MATLSRTSRRKVGSNDDLAEIPPPSVRPKRPARIRVLQKPAVDVLTPEEEYLLKVYRRYDTSSKAINTAAASPAAAAAAAAHAPRSQQPANRRSPSPPVSRGTPPRASPIISGGGVGGALAGKKPLAGKSAIVAGQPEEHPAPVRMDAIARAKMVLEKKRKASAAGFGLGKFGSGAASGAAGGLKKPKVSKVAGTPSSIARLDPVKYPASGLLLRDEFRTFTEVDSDGDRVFQPVEPLVRLLKNFGIADGSANEVVRKKQLFETLVMRVTVPAHSESWGINICAKDHKQFEEIMFHFNPRRRFVAMNNREGNTWGQQEKYTLTTRWPDMFNVSINVAVQIDAAGFHVAVDGKYCATFAHRTKLPASGEELCLQVMTEDDYGTNLGLVVHEIWWGHKDTMPGLPGAKEPSRRTTETWRGNNNEAFTDLHAAGLPPMPTPDKEEVVRKRLLDMFQPYGAVQVRVLHRDSKNYGFIKFREHNDAAKALEELGGAEVLGRPMRLSKAAGR